MRVRARARARARARVRVRVVVLVLVRVRVRVRVCVFDSYIMAGFANTSKGVTETQLLSWLPAMHMNIGAVGTGTSPAAMTHPHPPFPVQQ